MKLLKTMCMMNWLKKLIDKIDIDARIKDIKYKIPSITNLTTTAATTVSILVKKQIKYQKFSKNVSPYLFIVNLM